MTYVIEWSDEQGKTCEQHASYGELFSEVWESIDYTIRKEMSFLHPITLHYTDRDGVERKLGVAARLLNPEEEATSSRLRAAWRAELLSNLAKMNGVSDDSK